VEGGRGKYCSPDCFSEGQKHVFSDADKQTIETEWKNGAPSRTIAIKLGVGPQVMSRYLRQIGVFEKRYYSGSKHANWRGGTTMQGFKAKAFRLQRGNACEECKYCEIPQILEIHHIDRNRRNNEGTNLLLLCPTCHAKAHYDSHTGLYTRHGRKRIG
jgi:hypothetical protein